LLGWSGVWVSGSGRSRVCLVSPVRVWFYRVSRRRVWCCCVGVVRGFGVGGRYVVARVGRCSGHCG
jgi:hypothetical protein